MKYVKKENEKMKVGNKAVKTKYFKIDRAKLQQDAFPKEAERRKSNQSRWKTTVETQHKIPKRDQEHRNGGRLGLCGFKKSVTRRSSGRRRSRSSRRCTGGSRPNKEV